MHEVWTCIIDENLKLSKLKFENYSDKLKHENIYSTQIKQNIRAVQIITG